MALHILQDMQQCVRVLGYTDLRIEYILLLLCCFSKRRGDVRMLRFDEFQDTECIIGALLSELNDISTSIEEYHVAFRREIETIDLRAVSDSLSLHAGCVLS